MRLGESYVVVHPATSELARRQLAGCIRWPHTMMHAVLQEAGIRVVEEEDDPEAQYELYFHLLGTEHDENGGLLVHGLADNGDVTNPAFALVRMSIGCQPKEPPLLSLSYQVPLR